MASLTVNNVYRTYDGRRGQTLALENISLQVKDGEFLVLVGPSGCGKSTLLSLLAGLDRPNDGEILQDGARVTGPGLERGVVFQDGGLFPWLSARGNLEFALGARGVPRRERRAAADDLLRRVRLLEFADSHPHELSGGMRQRVAIARALALDPGVLLMDEPFSALDAQTREDLYAYLTEIWEETAKTIVFVTHNVREAVCLGTRVLLMSARPGRIAAEYPIRLDRPRFPDDSDVARIAHEISCHLRGDRRRVLVADPEELNYDGTSPGPMDPADALLHRPDPGLVAARARRLLG